MSNPNETRFKDEQAAGYDLRMPKLIAGYDTLYDITTAYLSTRLSENAHILVMGAGTCREIITLAQQQPKWRFTAVDPSQNMLEIGKEKLQAIGCDDRVTMICGTIHDVPDIIDFDAATSMLIMHFIPAAEKPGYLAAIRHRLHQGSPLMIADLMQPQLVDIQTQLSLQLGLEPDAAQQIGKRFSEYMHSLTEQAFEQLCRETQFSLSAKLFQSLGFHLWALDRV